MSLVCFTILYFTKQYPFFKSRNVLPSLIARTLLEIRFIKREGMA
jgi:hypothetical protein